MRGLIIFPVLVYLSVSCAMVRHYQNINDPPPNESIRISQFTCEDPVVAEKVRNIFIHTLTEGTETKVVLEGEADLVVGGTVLLAQRNLLEKMFRPMEVTEITALATQGAEVVASTDVHQTSAEGEPRKATEELAKVAAEKLRRRLIKDRLIR